MSKKIKHMSRDLLDHFNKVETFHWWWEGRRKLVGQLIGNAKPKNILDVGCGTGETLVFLKNKFPKSTFYGVDMDRKALGFTRKRGFKNIYLNNAVKLPFRKDTFDLILLLDVIEHIKDDYKLTAEMKRLLTKGGSLVITAPALNFIWSEHDEMQGHKRRYTIKRLRELAEYHDMEVEFVSYFNFFLALPIIAIRLLGKLPLLDNLNKYDSGLNYNIAFNKPVNSLLKAVFNTEIGLLKFVRYPYGISVAAKFVKK